MGKEFREEASEAARGAEEAVGSATATMSEEADHLRRRGGDLAEQARDELKEKYEQVRAFSHEAADKAREEWQRQRSRLWEMAGSLVSEQKGRLCKGMQDAASACHAAADTLEERNDPTVASYAHAAGEQIEAACNYIERCDVEDVARGVSSFTRRHPEWVIGGLFIAGIAAARLLKATPDHGGWQRADQGTTYGHSYSPSRARTGPASDRLFRDAVEQQHQGGRDFGPYGTSMPGGVSSTGAGMSEPSGRYHGVSGEAVPTGRPSGADEAGAPGFGSQSPVGLHNPTGHAKGPAELLTGGGSTDVPPGLPASRSPADDAPEMKRHGDPLRDTHDKA